jgi:UDP-glucose 4-epimerase
LHCVDHLRLLRHCAEFGVDASANGLGGGHFFVAAAVVWAEKSPMRALILGGAGYIGSAVAGRFLAAGWDVSVADALYSGDRNFLPKAVKFHHCDCGMMDAVGSIVKEAAFDVAISLTSLGRGCGGSEVVFRNYHNNFVATYYLLQTLVENRLRKFVFSSDFSVYGPPTGRQITDATAKNPSDSSGRSLHAVEALLRDLSVSCNLDYTVVRYGSVGGALRGGPAGPKARNGLRRPLSELLAVAGGSAPILETAKAKFPSADGTAPMDILHVADVADAYVKIACELARRGGEREFVLAGETPSSAGEFVRLAEAIGRRSIQTKQTDGAEFGSDQWRGDPRGAAAALGWRSRATAKEIVESEWRARRGNVAPSPFAL